MMSVEDNSWGVITSILDRLGTTLVSQCSKNLFKKVQFKKVALITYVKGGENISKTKPFPHMQNIFIALFFPFLEHCVLCCPSS